MEPTSTPAAAPASKPKRDPNTPPKSFGATVVDAKGNQLRFKADQKKTGYVVYAEHVQVGSDGKKNKDRGATARFETREEAQKEIDRGVAAATKAGWQKRVSTGFRTKADSFDLKSLPAPKSR